MSSHVPTTAPDDGVALGCVVFETHVLAAAMLVRQGGSVPPEALRAVATEALLLKARSLIDFFRVRQKPPEDSKRDILASLFRLQEEPLDAPMWEFRQMVNKRCAHLTVDRADVNLRRWTSSDGRSLDDCALWVLDAAITKIEAARAKGISLVKDSHKRLLPEVYRLRDAIREQRAQSSRRGTRLARHRP